MASGCRRELEPVRIGRVVIDAPREYDDPAGGREAVRRHVSERLRADSSTHLESDERDATHVLHVRVGSLFDAPAPRGAADVVDPSRDGADRPVQVRLRPVGTAPLYEVVSRGQGADPLRAATTAFDDAWTLIMRQRRLEAGSDKDLVAALEESDPRIRDFAIVRLGDRKSAAAVTPLCKLLEKEERPELVLRAIGSLVSIGDARAVEPLIDLSNRKDPDFVLQVVFAVGSIGGRTAEAYLVTMASGHPIEAIRRGAEQALLEMSHRKVAGAK